MDDDQERKFSVNTSLNLLDFLDLTLDSHLNVFVLLLERPEWQSQPLKPCLMFSPSQLRDCELAPGVNRDLARRVRNVNGITQHKQVLRNDIKLAAKLIHALDEKGELWSKFQEEGQSTEVQHRYNLNTLLSDRLVISFLISF